MSGRRRGAFATAILVAAVGLVAAAAGAGLMVTAAGRGGAAGARPAADDVRLDPGTPATPTVDGHATRKSVGYPQEGSGRWRYARGAASAAGRSGQLLRYRVAVEDGVSGLDPDAFAEAVSATLADPRGWTAGGRWRLQRVGRAGPYDFTVFLATPVTRDRLCAMGRDRYTSCRNGNRVVVNVARWVRGVPHYRGALAAYRQYIVNHEVGHRLGHGHEKCPGSGRPAPVMQQQTLGLHGCAPNPWPFRGSRRYAGPPGQYGDPVPRGP